MLHKKKNYAPEPSNSGEEDFKDISILNPRPYVTGPFEPQDHHLNKLARGLKKEIYFKYILFFYPIPPPQAHFGPQGHHLNKLGRGLLSNATYMY